MCETQVNSTRPAGRDGLSGRRERSLDCVASEESDPQIVSPIELPKSFQNETLLILVFSNSRVFHVGVVVPRHDPVRGNNHVRENTKVTSVNWASH